MEKVISSVKGIVNSISASQERIEQNTLSQKDRQTMSLAIGDIIESINNSNLQSNERIQQLREQLAKLQDAFFSQEPAQILQLQKNISEGLKPLEYEMNFNRLTADIFQTDSQIMTLQDEKAAAIQELIDLDIQVHGHLTDITKQVLEVNHVNIGEEKQQRDEKVPEENGKKDKYVGIAYVTDVAKTDRQNFHGESPEAILEAVREQQKKPNSPLAKVKTIYIQKEELAKSNSYLKYDIASGKDITPIYLKLPNSERYVKKDEFNKILAYLKENGASYNALKKAWYVTPEQDLDKFKDYLQDNVETEVNKISETIMQPSKPETTMLYGSKVRVDYYLRSEGLKIITQRNFDKIMSSWTRGEALNLSNCWFQNVNFNFAELSRLQEFNFSGSQFTDCLFNYAQFEKVDFSKVSMDHCEFIRSEFVNCNFSESSMANCHDKYSVIKDCNFENARLRAGYFKQTVMHKPDFNGAVINGTNFYAVMARGVSLENTVFTMGGATEKEVAAYEAGAREALQDYDKSISAEKGKPDKKGTVSNSLVERLNANKSKAEAYNKQNKPQEVHREAEPVK